MIEDMKAYMKQYGEKYRQEHKQEQKEYRQKPENKAKARGYRNKYYHKLENKEKINKYLKKQRQKPEFKERMNKYMKNYYNKYPERFKANNQAKYHIKIPENQLCLICNEKLATLRHHPDYSNPLLVVFCCCLCRIRSHRNPLSFYREIPSDIILTEALK